MKKTKIIFFGLLLISLFLPFIAVVHAEKKTPGYVGINEGQTIIWNTEFDRGPLEDYYEDAGETEEDAEEEAKEDMRIYRWDEEDEAWMMKIHTIGEHTDEFRSDKWEAFLDEVNLVKYTFSLYKTKDKADPNAWRSSARVESGKLWQPDEKFFEAELFSWYFGIFREETSAIPAFIIPKNLDYGDLADIAMEEIEDRLYDDYIDIGVAKIQHFTERKAVGIKTEVNDAWDEPALLDKVDDFESESRYNDDGILYYYEYSYDGDTIAKFEKEYIFGQNSEFYFENWWWMSLVAGAVIIGVIIVLVIIIKKKRS